MHGSDTDENDDADDTDDGFFSQRPDLALTASQNVGYRPREPSIIHVPTGPFVLARTGASYLCGRLAVRPSLSPADERPDRPPVGSVPLPTSTL